VPTNFAVTPQHQILMNVRLTIFLFVRVRTMTKVAKRVLIGAALGYEPACKNFTFLPNMVSFFFHIHGQKERAMTTKQAPKFMLRVEHNKKSSTPPL
jgi:hypothetical protein